MEIGKFNLTFLIKSVAIGFYLVYFIIFNSSLNIYLPEYKNYDTTIKKELISNKCFLIIGGSNARQGISAKIISENVCPALNLSINNEMENFSLYKNWLFNNLKDKEFKYILYSPVILWSDESILVNSNDAINFPNISIFSQLKSLLINMVPIFDSYGDLQIYSCKSEFNSYNLEESEFSKNNIKIAEEINMRTLQLENAFHTKSVYLRVPPIYVNSEEKLKAYTNLMNERIEIIKGFGVKIIGETTVSLDKSLFCDSYHSNAKGREIFSKQIKLP